eukprot:scaffold6781_cov22-Tisochrysis_lutea.AAC.3
MAEAVKEKPSSFAEVVENCCAQLRRRSRTHWQIQGSLPCAKRTAEIMRALLTMQRHPDAASLIDDVRAVGYKLQAAKPVGEQLCGCLKIHCGEMMQSFIARHACA